MTFLSRALGWLCLVVAFVSVDARADVTCSVSVGPPNSLSFVSYNSTTGTILSTTVTYDCNRGTSSDVVNSYSFYPTAGVNVSGATRRMAGSGPAYVNFDILKTNTSPFNTYWGNSSPTGSTPVTGNLNNGNFNSGHAILTFNVYVRIPPGQTPFTGLLYQELQVYFTGTCQSKNGSGGGATATICTVGQAALSPISLQIGSASCSISAIPNMSISYTSMQKVNSQAVSNFTVNCTNGNPYWMSLNSAAVSQAGATTTVSLTASNNINYSLSVPTGTKTGTGAQQNWSVIGTAAANQSGTCSSASCTSTAQQQTIYVNY